MRIFVLLLFILSCKISKDDTSEAQMRETYTWFKPPAVIKNIVEKTWKIRIDVEDDVLYFSKLGALYGAPDPITGEPLLRGEPRVGYALALDVVSIWLSEIIVEEQEKRITWTDDDSITPFKGQIGFDLSTLPDDEDCFKDDTKDWCDADDGIAIGMYTAADKERLLDPNSKEERKRLMHNIQDIGDFLGVTIDNLLVMDGSYEHVPHYLLDRVFVPALEEQTEDDQYPPPKDMNAWKKVVHTILMSGGFFMYLPNRS